jgi:surface protein
MNIQSQPLMPSASAMPSASPTPSAPPMTSRQYDDYLANLNETSNSRRMMEGESSWRPTSNEQLKEAIDWFCDPSWRHAAISRYGFPCNWDTSLITDMSHLFAGKSYFNEPIGTWNTENVIKMTCMFNDADSFNQDISGWNTKKVTDMEGMFAGAYRFNQQIGLWNTENVETMRNMFYLCGFNQDISGWNTSKVTDMAFMFSAADFNQNISAWEVRRVVTMECMFANATKFQGSSIEGWNVSNNICCITEMFSGACSAPPTWGMECKKQIYIKFR